MTNSISFNDYDPMTVEWGLELENFGQNFHQLRGELAKMLVRRDVGQARPARLGDIISVPWRKYPILLMALPAHPGKGARLWGVEFFPITPISKDDNITLRTCDKYFGWGEFDKKFAIRKSDYTKKWELTVEIEYIELIIFIALDTHKECLQMMSLFTGEYLNLEGK